MLLVEKVIFFLNKLELSVGFMKLEKNIEVRHKPHDKIRLVPQKDVLEHLLLNIY